MSDDTIENQGRNEEKSVEEYFRSIEDVLEKLEQKEVSLEESFLLYKEGMGLVKSCMNSIDQIEKQIQILDEVQEDEI